MGLFDMVSGIVEEVVAAPITIPTAIIKGVSNGMEKAGDILEEGF